MNRQLKDDIFLIVAIVVASLTVGYGVRGIVDSSHSAPPTPFPAQAKQPINITVFVPDRDITYRQGTLPGMAPRWKVGMHGKL